MAAPVEVAAASPQWEPERRLVELARAGAPLRRVVAALAGRLVARQAWGRLGYARLGDYARERLGVSARSLQEFARVDRALAELPGLEAALVSGRLPWSKVRLLARCGSPADEARWIARAEATRVRELEKTCRAVERGALGREALSADEEGGDTQPAEWVRLSAPIALAFAWRRAVHAAAQVAGERLGPAEALELVTAETLSALPVGLEDRDDGGEAQPVTSPAEEPPLRSGHGAGESVAAAPESGPVELPRFLRPLLAGLEDVEAFDLDARLRRAVRLEQRLDAEIAPLLRHVTAAEYAWRKRYRTLAAYARERLGMSPRKARALLRLERVGDLCPALRVAYRDGQLSWLQAQVLAPLLVIDAEGSWREVWVAYAGGVTLRRLEEAVDRALGLRESGPAAWHELREDPARLADGPAGGERQVCARTTDPLEQVGIRVHAPREVARLFHAALCRVRQALERETGRLASEAEGFAVMLAHALESWGVDDRALRRQLGQRLAILERDGWRCTVPGCTSRRNLQVHHVVFRSAGGPDTLENQTTLCAFHHHRGVHGGTLRIAGRAPDALCFELGTREGRPPLVRYRSGDRLVWWGVLDSNQ